MKVWALISNVVPLLSDCSYFLPYYSHVSSNIVTGKMEPKYAVGGHCHSVSHPQGVFKRTIHPQKIFFKYVKIVMLRTVTKNSTIIITWYHRYRKIIQINGGPPLQLCQKPDSKAGRRKLKCSDVTSAISILTWIIVSLER